MQSGRCESCFKAALPGKSHCLDHHKAQDRYAYGLDHELAQKMAAKLDPAKVQAVRVWVEAVTGRSVGADLQAGLKSGVTLCELINKLFPGSVPRINSGSMPFVQRENIVAYLDACKRQGMRETDLFVTADLFEGNNLVAVVDNLCSLGHLAASKGWRGAQLAISGGSVQVASGSSSAPVRAPAPPQVPLRDAPYAAPASQSAAFGGATGGSYRTAPVPPQQNASSPAASPSAAAPAAGPKFCSGCGTKRADMAAKFCGECGGKF